MRPGLEAVSLRLRGADWADCVCLCVCILCLQKEVHGLIEKYSLNDSLLEEIQKLREENRKHFNY